MKTYKAYIRRYIENLWLNPETGDYEGVDPDTYQDCGSLEPLTAPSKEELKEKIENLLGPIEYDHENRYMVSFDLEYHCSTPKEEQIPALDNYEIYIFEVTETDCTL
jgi:hypothetical protein